MRPPDLLDCVLIDVLWADRLSARSNLAHCNGHIPIIEMELTRRSWPGRQWICGKSQWSSAATAAVRDHYFIDSFWRTVYLPFALLLAFATLCPTCNCRAFS